MNNLKKDIFFSVIIPLYNKEQFIENTIQSVLKQTFQDFEIIVVDDGSTDDSLEKITQLNHPKITVLKQKNLGVSSARNNGIKIAKHEYIALLDADDIWHNNHLFELKKQILTFPNAGLYCNNYQVLVTKDLVVPTNLNFKYSTQCIIVKDYFEASINHPVAWTSAVAFSKEKFNAVGAFDLKLKTAQDLDLWIKMALNFEVSFNPIITMSYKLYVDNSLSKNEFNDIRYDFINSYSEQEKLNPSLNKYLDVNRYALAIRCCMNDEINLYKKIKTEIDLNNLNLKQKLLLKCSKKNLLLIKRIQRFFIKNNFYLTAYK